jgi:hypothetical protein
VGGGDALEAPEQPPADAAATRGRRHVHALHLGDRSVEVPDPADRHRRPVERDEQQLAARRGEIRGWRFRRRPLLVDRYPERCQDLVPDELPVERPDPLVVGRRPLDLFARCAQMSSSYSSQVDFSLVIES